LLIKEQINPLQPQIQLIRQRVQQLYQRGGGLTQQNEILAAAFEELEFALEQLQRVELEQRQKYEEWLNARAELEVESQYYQHLFSHAPAGYLVTSLDGTIRKANPIAAQLLECTERNLIGRSIAMFVPEGQRREFRARMADLANSTCTQEWSLGMQSWEQNTFEAGVIVMAVPGRANSRAIALHWLLRDIGAQQLAENEVNGHADRLAAAPDHAAARADADQTAARQHFMFLAKASVQLMMAQDLDGVLAHLAHMAVPEIADACVIDLTDPHTDQVQRLVVAREAESNGSVRTWRGSFAPEHQAGNKRNGHSHAAVRAPADAIDITNRAELRALFAALDPTSAIVAPIQCGGRSIGSLALVMKHGKHQYSAIDAALVEELARQAGLAIARLRS
jgi:hypothetical protein